MRIVKASAENFGSYKMLSFDFKNVGFALISGTTGAGKSTLLDLIPWILFGVTGKNGGVDDIRSWQIENPTCGILSLELPSKLLEIVRIRGGHSKNDLYISIDGSTPKRGKDIKETQKLIESELGISKEIYLAASTFNEFSTTGNFFTSSLQQRRQLFENIANLILPIKLKELTSNAKKELNKDLEKREKLAEQVYGKLGQLRNTLGDVERRKKTWDKDHQHQLDGIEASIGSFERKRQSSLEELIRESMNFELINQQEQEDLNMALSSKIYELELHPKNAHCKECNQPIAEVSKIKQEIDRLQLKLEKVESKPNLFLGQIENLNNLEDKHAEEFKFLKEQVNPFLSQIDTIICDIDLLEKEQISQSYHIDEIKTKIDDLSLLYDLSFELRGKLLKRVVSEIETSTNSYLKNYFDAEILVQFEIKGGDSLDVHVQKNAHECSYSQLSRGQRSILKLSFAISVMKASANEAGIRITQLFFDECLDGMSPDLKLKSVGLLRSLELEYESILVVDHATEIQNEFDKRFKVTLESNNSIIEEV